MRIAIDAQELLGRRTGVGRYLSELIAVWGRLPGTDRPEFVLCAPAPLDLPAGTGPHVRVETMPGRGTIWQQVMLPRLVREAGANVLLAPAYSGPIACRVPMVLNVHDISFITHPEWFSWRDGLRRRLLTRLSLRRATRVVTCSDFSKREIVQHLGVAPGQVDVVYFGAAATSAIPPGAGPPQAPACGSREPLVLYVGSIFARRRLPDLIEAFSRLARRRPGVRLEIVGENRSIPHVDLDGLIARSPAAGQVRVRSYLPEDQLSALYQRASAFVFLSDYEGFGLTPLEALAAGVPIVVLDTPVSREIYGPAALYVERPEPALVETALERVLFDDAERTRLLRAAPGVLERYSWRECSHRMLQVLLASAA